MVRNKKGQSFVEFLIALFLFLGIITTLMITSSIRIKDEAEKIGEQSAALKANLMADIALREAGPVNWQLDTVNVTKTCGLSDGNGHILISKVLALRGFDFSTYSGCLGTNTSWQLKYDLIGLGSATNAACLSPNLNTIAICKSSGSISVNLITTSLSTATYELEMFFSGVETLSQISNNLPGGSSLTLTNARNIYAGEAGTNVRGASLLAVFNMTALNGVKGFEVSTNAQPIIGFIKRVSVPTYFDFNLTLDNNLANDFLGARIGLNKKGIAEAWRFVLMNTTNGLGGVELVPARVRMYAWS
jgi:hypothetical protein